jgi:DNA-directed RNA polymerase specialized sigma24 family protein
MAEEAWPTTSGTLLVKLANAAHAAEWNEAWTRFVRLYRPGILTWCRTLGLQNDDAEEVLSRVLTNLHQKMAFFECRRWLRTALQQSVDALADEPAAMPPVLRGVGAVKDLLNAITPEETVKVAHLKGLTDPTSAAAWETAWSGFQPVYRPVILRCCERWGVGQDQAQQVAERLLNQMGPVLRTMNAAALPRFRAWLSAVVRNAARDCIDEIGRLPHGAGNDSIQSVLVNQESKNDFVNEIVLAEVRQQAEEKVRTLVNPAHWDAYRLKVHDGLPADEIARQTGLTVGNVYQAAHRVKNQVKEEMRRLAADAAEDREEKDEGNP